MSSECSTTSSPANDEQNAKRFVRALCILSTVFANPGQPHFFPKHTRISQNAMKVGLSVENGFSLWRDFMSVIRKLFSFFCAKGHRRKQNQRESGCPTSSYQCFCLFYRIFKYNNSLSYESTVRRTFALNR
jgi:hypothetical protein